MARPLRIEFPGALYHVTARGNDRGLIFLDNADRLSFLATVGKTMARWRWRGYAYCLMGNHYHLVVETADANLSRGMRHLNGVYSQGFNRRHGRSGHVFQGRYTSILVDGDAYLLELARYAALNPVRAGMARRAEDWPWSSYRAMTGQAAAPAWLHADSVLRRLGHRPAQARQAFAAFVADGLDETGRLDETGPWRDLTRQIYLGGEDFVEAMQKQADGGGESEEIPRVQRSPPVKSLHACAQQAATRQQAMALAYATGAYSMAEIARFFRVHYSTVSRNVKRYDELDEG